MVNIRKILAKNIKEIRYKKKLTQEKLAEKASMSLQYLAMIELAQKFPSGEMLERIANALGIETYELLAFTPSTHNELETLRNEIISEVKTLNETLANEITEKVIEAIKRSCIEKNKK